MPCRPALRDTVFETLRSAIVRGVLPSGKPLREKELARELGVSRTPVREAVQRLFALALAQRANGRTLIVRNFSAKDVGDLYYVRSQLETAAAKLAATRSTEQTLTALRRSVQEMAVAAQQGETTAYQRHHRSFHMRIADASENPYLARQIQGLLDGVDAIWASARPMDTRYSKADVAHREILSAIVSHHSAAAARAMAQHLARSLALILKDMQPDSSEVSRLRQLMDEVVSPSGASREGRLTAQFVRAPRESRVAGTTRQRARRAGKESKRA